MGHVVFSSFLEKVELGVFSPRSCVWRGNVCLACGVVDPCQHEVKGGAWGTWKVCGMIFRGGMVGYRIDHHGGGVCEAATKGME
jgi:hypothetical protein